MMHRRRSLDSMTIRVEVCNPVPETTAAGMRAHEHRRTAITNRLPVARGARVRDVTRFLDACEGLSPEQIADDKAAVERQGRWELDIILTWVLPILGFWGAVVAIARWLL